MNQTLPPFQLTSKRYPYNAYTIESAIEREQAIAQRLRYITISSEGNSALTLRVELHNLIADIEGAK